MSAAYAIAAVARGKDRCVNAVRPRRNFSMPSFSPFRFAPPRLCATICFPENQNNFGSRGISSAIRSSSGYFSRSGSGTFTFAPFSIAISSSAFTAALP